MTAERDSMTLDEISYSALGVEERSDEVTAAALIDRLLHHCHIVNIRGSSYRMRAHRDLLRTGRRDEDADRSQAT